MFLRKIYKSNLPDLRNCCLSRWSYTCAQPALHEHTTWQSRIPIFACRLGIPQGLFHKGWSTRAAPHTVFAASATRENTRTSATVSPTWYKERLGSSRWHLYRFLWHVLPLSLINVTADKASDDQLERCGLLIDGVLQVCYISSVVVSYS